MGGSSTVAVPALPVDATSFINRRTERKQARTLLGQSRLVTITGTGGVGKTRLALEVAREVSRTFDDVWFVDLGPLAPSESVPDAVASGIGFRSAEPDSTADLAEHIGQRTVLLILDGCEHVLPDTADLVLVLLRLCPKLRMIVTSRAPLRLTPEVVLTVGTLTTPARSDRHSSPAASAAVQLFVERAERAHHGIDTSVDLETIAEICRQLDGLPLAIELAAARVKALTPGQIHDRLKESFRILSGGHRDTPHRQQSIRLAIDWSYRLCTPDEQRIWREMSVFVGGWDLAAAEWVNRAAPVAVPMLDLVQSLLEKSIVARRQTTGTTWYSMLSTLRQYGREQLTVSGALREAQEHHRDWYRELLHRAEREWIGPDQAHWLAVLRRELPNIRAALVYSTQTQDGDAVLDLTTAAWRICWQADGRIDELRRWLLRGVALPGTEVSPLRAQAFSILAAIEGYQGDTRKAAEHLKQARSLEREVGDPYTRSFVDTAEAVITTDADRAVELYTAAMKVRPGGLENVARANTTALLSLHLDRIGRTAEAGALRNRLLEIAAERGEQYESSYLLMHAGAIAARRGDLDAALDMSRASLRLKRTLVNPIGVAHTEETLASVAVRQGHYRLAATLLGAAAAEREKSGILPSSVPPFVSEIDAATATARKILGKEAFARAFERGVSMSRHEGIALALDERPTPQQDKAVGDRHDTQRLTSREREVAALVARGLSDRDIASELVVSRRTAEGHVQRILVKLGLTSRTRLAAWYLDAPGESETPAPG